MPEPDFETPGRGNGTSRFTSTHWSVVVAAAQSQSPEAEAALEQLCRAYWYPLYAFLRRKGSSPVDAEDLTQEFFARRIVTRAIFQGIDPARGRFRTWLLNSLQNFVRNDHARRRALKRGGPEGPISLDLQDAEGRYAVEPVQSDPPETLFDRAWALTLLREALAQLQAKHTAGGKSVWFETLKCFLTDTHSLPSYAEVATRLAKSEDAVKNDVSRLRKQYGQLLRTEIKRTVSDPQEIQDELRHLMEVLGG